jgi:hypothetical protein
MSIGFVSQYGAIVILGLFLLLSFFQAHPRASAILVHKPRSQDQPGPGPNHSA